MQGWKEQNQQAAMIRSQRFVYSLLHARDFDSSERKEEDFGQFPSLPLREAWLQSVQMCSALLLVKQEVNITNLQVMEGIMK